MQAHIRQLLAVGDYQRPDPLDGFHDYRGDFDVHSNDYWASVVYSGKFGYYFAIAFGAFVLLWGLIVAIVACVRGWNFRKAKSGTAARIVWLLAFAAIVCGCAVCIAAAYLTIRSSADVRDEVYSTTDALLVKVDDVNGTIALLRSQVDAAEKLLGGSDSAAAALSSAQDSVNDVRVEIVNTQHTVDRVFRAIRIASIVAAAVVLAAVVVVLVGAGFKVQWLLYIFLVMAFVVGIAYWVLAGVSKGAVTFSQDLCHELYNYQYNNSPALSKLIPCPDSVRASNALLGVKQGLVDIVQKVNNRLEGIPFSVPLLCEPYNLTVSNALANATSCPYPTSRNSIALSQVSTLETTFSPFVCKQDDASSCPATQPISRATFDTFSSLASTAQNITQELSAVEDLVTCNVAYETAGMVYSQHCGPLQSKLHDARVAFITGGAGVLWIVFIVLLFFPWFKRRRAGAHEPAFSDCNVQPHSRPRSSAFLMKQGLPEALP